MLSTSVWPQMSVWNSGAVVVAAKLPTGVAPSGLPGVTFAPAMIWPRSNMVVPKPASRLP